MSERLSVPGSVILLRNLHLESSVYSLCPSYDSQFCFVGLAGGSVSQVCDDFILKKQFANMGQNVNGLCQTDDKLLGLVYKRRSVYSLESVHSATGGKQADARGDKLFQSIGGHVLKLACVKDQIIAPKPDRKTS